MHSFFFPYLINCRSSCESVEARKERHQKALETAEKVMWRMPAKGKGLLPLETGKRERKEEKRSQVIPLSFTSINHFKWRVSVRRKLSPSGSPLSQGRDFCNVLPKCIRSDFFYVMETDGNVRIPEQFWRNFFCRGKKKTSGRREVENMKGTFSSFPSTYGITIPAAYIWGDFILGS